MRKEEIDIERSSTINAPNRRDVSEPGQKREPELWIARKCCRLRLSGFQKWIRQRNGECVRPTTGSHSVRRVFIRGIFGLLSLNRIYKREGVLVIFMYHLIWKIEFSFPQTFRHANLPIDAHLWRARKACLVPKTCRHPLLSARPRKGKTDKDRKPVH